jgi:hypothetical protein
MGGQVNQPTQIPAPIGFCAWCLTDEPPAYVQAVAISNSYGLCADCARRQQAHADEVNAEMEQHQEDLRDRLSSLRAATGPGLLDPLLRSTERD